MKKVYNMGTNDVPSMSRSLEYTRWASMLQRCYDPASLERDKSYLLTEVCDEWLTFSKFLSWIDGEIWRGKTLDKDLIGKNLYSPETCLFISPELNRYWTGARSPGLVGTNYEKDRRKWKASIKLPGDGRSKTLGRFNTEEEAHAFYMREKIKNLSYFLATENPKVVRQLKKMILENN